MTQVNRFLTVLLFAIAAASIAIGAIFVYQAVDKENWIKQAMRQEKVTLGIAEEAVKKGDVIDTAAEAQTAADIVREHRRSLAPNYESLLARGRYDHTNPKHLTYTQALNMENYLYMAVLALGVTLAFTGIGAFMITGRDRLRSRRSNPLQHTNRGQTTNSMVEGRNLGCFAG